jgi:hypothetical protein
MFFSQIKDRRFSELKILLEIKNAKLVCPSLVYILCFRLTKGAQFIFQSLGKLSVGPTFLLKVPNNVLQLTIMYFPKFREDHPGFRSPNSLGELIIKIILQMFLT